MVGNKPFDLIVESLIICNTVEVVAFDARFFNSFLSAVMLASEIDSMRVIDNSFAQVGMFPPQESTLTGIKFLKTIPGKLEITSNKSSPFDSLELRKAITLDLIPASKSWSVKLKFSLLSER